MTLNGACALTQPLRPFVVPIRFTLSKKWRKRLKRIKGVAVKAGIAVAGAALSTVTFGASAVVAAGALAALAARDKAKAAAAQRAAQAKAAAGVEATTALVQSVAQNQVDLGGMIRGILNGSQQPPTQDPGTQQIIQGALGFGPMPGTSGPSVLETAGIAVGLGGLVFLAGGPLLLAAAAGALGAVADQTGFIPAFFNKIRGK
jgi:hypothetical protein